MIREPFKIAGAARPILLLNYGLRVAGGLLLLSLFTLPTLTWSQAPKTDQRARVNVGAAPTLAGDTVDIPLTFSAPETTKIGSLAATLSFSKKLLALTKAVSAVEQSRSEIKTSTKDDSGNPELALLEITISSKEPMKPGVLGYLKFKVSPEARKGTLSLKVIASKATTESGRPLPMAKGQDGAIGVFDTTEEMPVTGCFFFSH